MKTLFITVYDGAISKNILRTDVFKILSGSCKIILFVPSEKREYYENEFATDNVLIEIVPPPDHPEFEKRFQSFALHLFHTRTVRIKIEYEYAKHGNLFKMLLKLLFWHIGRFTAIHRLIRKIYELVPDHSFESYFEKYNPDAVFVPNMMSNDDYRLIKSARTHNVLSIGMPKSWDNFTTKTFFNIFPDYVLVQNEIMKEGASKLFGYPKGRMTVVGFPQFDVYRDTGVIQSREIFCREMGLDPDKKIVLYAAAGRQLAPNDEEVLVELIEGIHTDKSLKGQIQILVRPHPKYGFDESRLTNKRDVVIDSAGITVTEKKSTWEFYEKDIVHLANSLYHMDVLISTASTLNLEGAIFDRPLISIAYDGHKVLPLGLSTARYYFYEHLSPLAESGGMSIVRSKDELFKELKSYISDPRFCAEQRKRIVQEVVWNNDGKSGERVAKLILRKIASTV